MVEVARIEKFLQEHRLCWLGHVVRMNNKKWPEKALHLNLEGSKKDRPKKRLEEVVEKDIVDRDLKRRVAQDCLLRKLGYKNWLPPAC